MNRDGGFFFPENMVMGGGDEIPPRYFPFFFPGPLSSRWGHMGLVGVGGETGAKMGGQRRAKALRV